jgi:hypothetical protein
MPITYGSNTISEIYYGATNIYKKPQVKPSAYAWLSENITGWDYNSGSMDSFQNGNPGVIYRIIGVDPIMARTQSFSGTTYRYLYISLRCNTNIGISTGCQIFFENGAHGYSEAQSLTKLWPCDGQLHLLKFDMHNTALDWNGSTITNVRIDPSYGGVSGDLLYQKIIYVQWAGVSSQNL